MSTIVTEKLAPLWSSWRGIVSQLRPAFARTRAFLWFAVALAATCTRADRGGDDDWPDRIALDHPGRIDEKHF